jgi:lipopolysaccharide export system protein LptA
MLTAGAAAPALAERADRDKPVNIESDRMTADDSKKTATFDGRVVLSQGTLVIRADRIVVRQDNEGFQFGSATGGSGGTAAGLASFRQKREGANDYIDAEAERIEYDGKADKVEFFTRARLRKGGGDDVCGNYISYDSRSEFFSVNSGKSPSGTAQSGSRVHAVLMPRNATPSEQKPAAKPAPCPN